MNQPLRPMNLGEILDQTFQIYKSRFWVFVGIAALPALVMMSIHLADTAWWQIRDLVKPFREPGITIWNAVLSIGYFHISSVLFSLFAPALIHAAEGEILHRPSSNQGSLKFLGRRWLIYFNLAFLKTAGELIIPEVITVGLILLTAFIGDSAGLFNSSTSSTFIAFVILIPELIAGSYLFLHVGACLALSIPACSLESLGSAAALRRSWKLSKGERFRIAMAWLLIALVGWILTYSVQFVIRWILTEAYWQLHFRLSSPMQYSILIRSIFAVISILTAPLYYIAITLFYYDQRIRKEGYDIEQMMQVAGWTTDIVPVSQPLPGPESLPEAHA